MEEHKAEEQSQPSKDYLDELERLAELKDKGIITQEQFEAKRNQLLNP